MNISANTASIALLGNTTTDPIATDAAKAATKLKAAQARGNEAKDTLDKLTGNGVKGYWAWKMNELRKQLTEKTMKEMNLTPEKLAGMSNAERSAIEKKIQEVVEQQIQLAMQQEMQRHKQRPLIASNSLHALIRATQEIGGA